VRQDRPHSRSVLIRRRSATGCDILVSGSTDSRVAHRGSAGDFRRRSVSPCAGPGRAGKRCARRRTRRCRGRDGGTPLGRPRFAPLGDSSSAVAARLPTTGAPSRIERRSTPLLG
jgi:hypothetical protein